MQNTPLRKFDGTETKNAQDLVFTQIDVAHYSGHQGQNLSFILFAVDVDGKIWTISDRDTGWIPFTAKKRSKT